MDSLEELEEYERGYLSEVEAVNRGMLDEPFGSLPLNAPNLVGVGDVHSLQADLDRYEGLLYKSLYLQERKTVPQPIKQKPAKKTPGNKTTASRPSNLPAAIKPLGFGMEDRGVRVVVYGASGTGKTTFWATFPGKILCLVASGGVHSGELLSLDTPEYRKKIMKWEIEETRDVDEAVRYLQGNPKEFSTVVMDHGSGLQDLTLKEVLGLDEIPAQIGWGTAKQQQWGTVAVQMKERFRSLFNLTNNIVVVAQERENELDDEVKEMARAYSPSFGLLPTVGAALIPSVAGWLNPAADYIVNTFIRRQMIEETSELVPGEVTTELVPGDRVEYCLRVGPNERYTTKFRVPKADNKKLPDVVVDPTYAKLMKLVK